MKSNYYILIVVGARPQIMKAAALANALKGHSAIEFDIVHSGQHYDKNLSQNFFEEFELKAPKYQFNIGSKSHNIFIAEFLLAFDPILEKVQPDMVVVVGDTNTTSAAAIASAKRNIPLAHVEAGLREWNKSIPEEINKMLTDSVSDLYFSPTKTGKQNLQKEGKHHNVFITGDITLDLLNDPTKFWAKAQIEEKYLISKDYVLLTCHRAATTDDIDLLTEVVEGANSLGVDVIWPVHPRTKNAMLVFNLQDKIGENVQLINPVGFYETQSLIKHAKCVITDSGGIIKEAYFHSTPGIIIDNQTEWIETVAEGWNVIAGPNRRNILEAYNKITKPTENLKSLGSGNAGVKIVDRILKFLQDKED